MNHFIFHQGQIGPNNYDLEMIFVDHKDKRETAKACLLTMEQIPRRCQLFMMSKIIEFAKATLDWRNRAYQENFTPSKFALLDRLALTLNSWASMTSTTSFANYYKHNLKDEMVGLLPRPDSRLYPCAKKRLELIETCIQELDDPIEVMSFQTSLFGLEMDMFQQKSN